MLYSYSVKAGEKNVDMLNSLRARHSSTYLTPARRLRQGDLKFKADLSDLARCYLKTKMGWSWSSGVERGHPTVG